MEVQKSRNLSATHSGMQAYRSTLASPKVVEVVNQFPLKVTLNEVPRLSTWPAQFQDAGGKEHDVALFFFAKDVESYEKNYKPLIDTMIQKDVALKGNHEGVELLIFASNQLPENCQRWNMLFFLWGVFLGKKESCSYPLKNTFLPLSCLLPNMGKSFSTREAFRHEKPSNREYLTDHISSRMQSCMKEESAKDGKPSCVIEKEKAVSVSVEDTEEGEIGISPNSNVEKTSGPKTLNSSNMNQKVDLDELNNEGLCECPCEEKIIKENTATTERIVFSLDLNDRKEDDDEMVDNNPGPLGNENNKQSSLLGTTITTSTGVLPFTARITSIEEHRSSTSYKPQEDMVNQKDNVASLSLSLSFSSLEKEQQQQR